MLFSLLLISLCYLSILLILSIVLVIYCLEGRVVYIKSILLNASQGFIMRHFGLGYV